MIKLIRNRINDDGLHYKIAGEDVQVNKEDKKLLTAKSLALLRESYKG